MASPFEARKQSFYVSGEMTDFDVASVKDYLGKLGLRIVAKPLPPEPVREEELPIFPSKQLITREDADRNAGNLSSGHIWARLIKRVGEEGLPLELGLTENGILGVTYDSAQATLTAMGAPDYEGPHLSALGTRLLDKCVFERSSAFKYERLAQAQDQAQRDTDERIL